LIVYVESNFVLELALLQEQAAAAQTILEHAETGALTLVLPAFALSEPFATVTNQGTQRNKLSDELTRQERELGRSALHQSLAAQLKQVWTTLTEVRKAQMDSLEQTMERLLGAAQQVALDLPGFQQARLYETRYGLTPQDAIIYAVIVGDLQRRPIAEPKVFVNRNAKDFDDPGIKAELQTYNCRYIGTFADGLSYIENQLNKDQQG
jgi:predicted nucleic acid-binding protein